MKIKINNPQIFYKYLISYVAIFMIPILLIGIFVLPDFLNTLREEVLNNQKQSLYNLSQSMDMKFEEMTKISSSIMNNTRLNPFFLKEKGYRRVEAVNELRNYRATSGFIADILLHISGEDFIFSASGIYEKDSYNSSIFSYINAPSDVFLSELESINIPTLKNYSKMEEYEAFNMNREKYLLYFIPFSQAGLHPFTMVVFVIEEKKVSNILDPIQQLIKGNTMILDYDKNVIVAANNNLTSNIDEIDINEFFDGSDNYLLDYEGEKYLISNIQSQTTGWYYVSFIPEEKIMQIILKMQAKIAILSLSGIFLGILIIMIFMKVNYSPIRSLLKKFEGRSDKKSQNIGIKELNNALDEIFITQDELLEKIQAYQSQMKSNLYSGILKGQYKDEAKLSEIIKAAGVKFEYKFFRVVILEEIIDESGGENSNESISKALGEKIDKIENQFPENSTFIVELRLRNFIALIINHKSDESYLFHNYMKSLKEEVYLSENKKINFYAGGVCEKISGIAVSYFQALSLIDFENKDGNGIIIFDKDKHMTTDLFGYDRSRLKDINLLIKQGNTGEIKNIIIQLLNQPKKRSSSVLYMQYIKHDIVNTILGACKEFNYDISLSGVKFDDIIKIYETYENSEFENAILQIAESLCEHVLNDKESKNIDLCNEIIKYIEINFKKSDLSIQQIADYFGYSYKYICRYFKDQTGCSLSDYIGKLRMDYIKQSLRDTNKSISSLIENVGFENVSSFNRKFKSSEGITPNQYRMLFRNEKSLK